MDKYDESIDMESDSEESLSVQAIPPPPSYNSHLKKAVGIGKGAIGGNLASTTCGLTNRQRFNEELSRGLKSDFNISRTQKLIKGFQSGALTSGDTDSDEDESNLSSFLEEDDYDPSSAGFLGEDYGNWIDSVINEIPCPYKTFRTPPVHDEDAMKEYLKLVDIWEMQIDMKRSRLAEFTRKNCLKPGVCAENCVEYNPDDYSNITVSREMQNFFKYISEPQLPPPVHQQVIDSEQNPTKMRPFIPDYYSSVGEIDAFIKVIEPKTEESGLGLICLDEPSLEQSDPSVLGLKLKAVAKQRSDNAVVVKSVDNVSENSHLVDKWIKDITELHHSKPSPSVHYSKPMPDIDTLLQEWPPEVEEVLKNFKLPDPNINCDLGSYAEIVCNMLDIPVYKSKIESLHSLFSLYAAYKDFKTESFMDILNLEDLKSVSKEDFGAAGDN